MNFKYLGLWVTRNGVKPTNKNKEAITNTDPPNYFESILFDFGLFKFLFDRRSFSKRR